MRDLSLKGSRKGLEMLIPALLLLRGEVNDALCFLGFGGSPKYSFGKFRIVDATCSSSEFLISDVEVSAHWLRVCEGHLFRPCTHHLC